MKKGMPKEGSCTQGEIGIFCVQKKIITLFLDFQNKQLCHLHTIYIVNSPAPIYKGVDTFEKSQNWEDQDFIVKMGGHCFPSINNV